MESDSQSPTPSQKESIAQILVAGWHLLNLINEILDLAVILRPERSRCLENRCRWTKSCSSAGR